MIQLHATFLSQFGFKFALKGWQKNKSRHFSNFLSGANLDRMKIWHGIARSQGIVLEGFRSSLPFKVQAIFMDALAHIVLSY